MDNSQYQSSNTYSAGYYAAPNQSKSKSKFKFIIIGIIVAIIVGLIAFIVFAINKNQNQDNLPAKKENTATLQIYAALADEIPIDDLDATVKKINNDAVVTIGDGYGTIEIPSDAQEFVSFYFETAETTEEDSSEEELAEEEPLPSPDEYEEDGDNVEKVYPINVAYGFTYVHPIDDEDAITISSSDQDSDQDSGQNIFYYYNGFDIYEFPTKQEAIEAYLAPTIEE